jgi:hypothetical protein
MYVLQSEPQSREEPQDECPALRLHTNVEQLGGSQGSRLGFPVGKEGLQEEDSSNGAETSGRLSV